jgi:Arc/MetJ family transcription regulator
MARTMIDIDDEALAEAAKVLGTTTKKDTVNTALREAVARLRRIDAIREAQAMAARGDIDLEFLDDLEAAEKAAAARHEARMARREAPERKAAA